MLSRRSVVGLGPLAAVVVVGDLAWRRTAASGASRQPDVTVPMPTTTTSRAPSATSSTTSMTATSTYASPATSARPTPAAVAWQRQSSALTQTLTAYAVPAPVVFAATLTDAGTGRSYAFHGGTRFETASVVKVDILATLLLRAQDRGRSLTSGERSPARSMIHVSATTRPRTCGGRSAVSPAWPPRTAVSA